MSSPSSRSSPLRDVITPHEAASRRARDLATHLRDAVARCEARAWSTGRLDEGADAIELRLLARVHACVETMSHRLCAMVRALEADGREERSELRGLSESLERARREAFAATVRALEGVNEEREVCRACVVFLEMPGDRAMAMGDDERDVRVVERDVAESPLRAARREAERAFAPSGTSGGAVVKPMTTAVVQPTTLVDDESMSDADCAKMFDKFNAYSQPETPMYQNSYEARAFQESEVKSNRVMDSPGGGISEDSAYGSPEHRGKATRGKVSQAGGGLGGLASFALGTALAVLATMGLNTTRGDALKRAAIARAKDAGRGMKTMARKTSSAVKDAVDKKTTRDAEASAQPAPRTYEIRHTRRVGENEEVASTIDRYGRENVSGMTRARVQNYRWKPSVVIGHG